MNNINTLANLGETQNQTEQPNEWEKTMQDVPTFSQKETNITPKTTAEYESELRSINPNSETRKLEQIVADYKGNRSDFAKRGQYDETSPLPSRFEVICDSLENSPSMVEKYINEFQEWFQSDIGDEREKKYRALTHIRIIDGGIKYGENNEKYIEGTVRPYGAELLQKQIKAGKTVTESFSSLSEKEKEDRWNVIREEYREKLLEVQRYRKRDQKWQLENSQNNTEKALTNETAEYNGYNETTALPDQGPNAYSPLFNEYPTNPF